MIQGNRISERSLAEDPVLMLGSVLAGLRFSRIVLGGMGAYVAGNIIWFSSKVEEAY